LSDSNLDKWLEVIRRCCPAGRSLRLLDLGCGTGRFALPLAARLPGEVVGADSSLAMLTVAAQKQREQPVAWVNCSAELLPFAPGSFDVVFMSHLLHHVDSPPAAIAECHRVLVADGVLLNRYGAIEQIQGDVEHTFFAGAIDLDRSRTPSVAAVENWLKQAGFRQVESWEVMQHTYETPQQRLAAIRGKGTSVMSLISPAALTAGLQRLEAHIRSHPDDPWLLHDRLTLTVAHK
jgi:ubiquinone/menaquinone biosynthesis C-methylase UbiE